MREHGPLHGLGPPHPPALKFAAEPGSLIVLATDGLVERRHEDLERLAAAVEEASGFPEEACVHLLEGMTPDGGGDVALMAVRLNRLPRAARRPEPGPGRTR
ncbi:hypothetical protein VT52_003330 [Streptomyces malaysiense]|uniref:PPM-type phosphatase domain-containing protein n=1 Tax=Streptomyces malaysiense TaxID=1428626 RepID=A0A1J4Q7D8_9ACTN|nr:hypothetical protein VT52_003330 [Streptomyces malaysiense]